MIPGCLHAVIFDPDEPAPPTNIETIVASERFAPWEAPCCDVFLENGRVSCCVSTSDFEAYELWNSPST